MDALSKDCNLKNKTLFCGTCLYSISMGVPPPTHTHTPTHTLPWTSSWELRFKACLNLYITYWTAELNLFVVVDIVAAAVAIIAVVVVVVVVVAVATAVIVARLLLLLLLRLLLLILLLLLLVSTWFP